MKIDQAELKECYDAAMADIDTRKAAYTRAAVVCTDRIKQQDYFGTVDGLAEAQSIFMEELIDLLNRKEEYRYARIW